MQFEATSRAAYHRLNVKEKIQERIKNSFDRKCHFGSLQHRGFLLASRFFCLTFLLRFVTSKDMDPNAQSNNRVKENHRHGRSEETSTMDQQEVAYYEFGKTEWSC